MKLGGFNSIPLPHSSNLNKIRSEITRERKYTINLVNKPKETEFSLKTRDLMTISTLGDKTIDSFNERLSSLNRHKHHAPLTTDYSNQRKKYSIDFNNISKTRENMGFNSKLNSLKYSLMTRGMDISKEELVVNPIFSAKGKRWIFKIGQDRIKKSDINEKLKVKMVDLMKTTSEFGNGESKTVSNKYLLTEFTKKKSTVGSGLNRSYSEPRKSNGLEKTTKGAVVKREIISLLHDEQPNGSTNTSFRSKVADISSAKNSVSRHFHYGNIIALN
jgi:hypothetical protein